MTAPARLLGLRLQGFKSFGERTTVEFGPGISAVVGPNGSGKSNLADALRWALGEQGRALRLRKSEDVIFAGSEKRSALGMADVTLVFGNSDGLLPIDFETVELGRRLFRSGENDYLLNRQRVRLKDLVDLLDGAHLADNAFLFIGQGMVDQALALRPEERRPLFEEVAGVRRHERRKSRAEEQLAEAETNLARVEDVLAELRPQARRLGAQAEQQLSRLTAGEEYGRGIIALAASRWTGAAARAGDAGRRLGSWRSQIDTALGTLREAEERAADVARELAFGSETEAERRTVHEAARAVLTELQLRDARAQSDASAAQRDRQRLEAELAGAQDGLAVARRELAAPLPARDVVLSAAVAEAERALGEALAELSAMRSRKQAEGAALAAMTRIEAAQAEERETARRRLGDAERQATDERAQADEAARRLAEAEKACAAPRSALESAMGSEKAATVAREAARAELDLRDGVRQATAERAAATASRAAAMRGRLDALGARLAEDEARGIAKAARKVGGRALSEGLEVEAGFRVAVEAALGEAMRGYVVGRNTVPELEGQRGVLILASETPDDENRRGSRADLRDRAQASGEGAVAGAAAHGGGRLLEAIRVDPAGAASRILARSVWVPELAAALAVQKLLPDGWIVVTRDGSTVTALGVVSVGRFESLLERRAEIGRLGEEVARLETDAAQEGTRAVEAAAAAASARGAFDAAREGERRATSIRREAEESERSAARDLEAVVREAAWHSSQAIRLEAERDRLRAAVRQSAEPLADRDGSAGEASAMPGAAPESPPLDATPSEGPAQVASPVNRASALAEWEARAASLRARRDELAAEEAAVEAVRREVESRRAQAAAAASLDQRRIAGLERQMAELAARERQVGSEREILGEALAAATVHEAALRAELDELRASASAARARLAEAEAATSQARERLRICQDGARSAEVAELEARLELDAIREQVLVELAGLGDLGLRLLAGEGDEDRASWTGGDRQALGGVATPEDPDAGPEDSLEAALADAATRWAAAPAVEPPGPAKLASLRRRFHELGAPNPFAADEYRAVKTRLDGLEAQRADLTVAIAKTRDLIEQLNAMIATQFRTTFAALETAFEVRFRQLFDGGSARLSLTEPEDLAATGIEIVARPPGKKAQPLSMLSGGERALTAVALLFAMLEVHPVPFCVLDEVDAALDEANVGRFAEALRGLADQTQFIVITHNRGTIEIADALYGVTIGDDAVSRVISLRLEEAREMADRVSRTSAATAARGQEVPTVPAS